MEKDYLMHFNPFHDPKNGRFASGGNSGTRFLSRKNKRNIDTRTYDEKKQDAIKKGTATEVLKFRGDLTNNELQQAVNRINMEQRLESVSEKEISAGQRYAKSFFKGAGRAITIAGSAAALSTSIVTIKSNLEKIKK